jgi:hypothetical protein
LLPISGEGLKKVLIVSERDWHNRHFMMDRLMNRSSNLDKSYFYFTSLANAADISTIVKDHGIKTVVGLGESVLNRLIGEKDIIRWRGRPLEWAAGTLFVPTFAPHRLLPENPNAEGWVPQGALVNPPRFQGVWMLDVGHALHVAKHGFVRKKGEYLVDPTPEEFRKWAEGYFAALAADSSGTRLSYDIETAYKQKQRNEDEFEEEAVADGTLLRISFSYREYTGVSVPWMSPYLDVVQALLASDGIKVGWNCLGFDNPILEKNGAPVQGMVYDGMDMFHLYQSDLPRGLEWVTSFTSDMLPWKHLNYSDPGLYSAIDPDAAIRNTNWLELKLSATGQWDTFLNHYARLMPAMHTAGKRGNYIDIAKRDLLREEMSKLMALRVQETQPMVPMEVKPLKRYKRQPFDGSSPDGVWTPDLEMVEFPFEGRTFKRAVVTGKVKFCTACGARDVKKSDHFKGTKEPGFDKKGKPKLVAVKNPCKLAGGEIVEREADVVEWDEILDFNPNSTEQLKAYARHFGHPLGQDKKDASKEAMDSGHLKTLAKDYKKDHGEFYSRVLEIKKLSKTLGTYIYNPDEENLIHTTYSNAPSTPRFSSRNVNLQNVGKREDNYWATRAREQIVARPGHRFVQADSSAIEALVQGWWMGDPVYMQLATQSVHAFVVAKQHGIPWVGDEEQVSYLKHSFKDDYNKMKTTNYLTNFGGGPYLLYKSFPDVFPTKKAAEDAQDFLYSVLPKLKEFHHWVRTKAQKESYLELPGWRHRHYFYDVFTHDPKTGKVKYGRDAKRVCAFFPQGCAAAFMRDNSLLLAYGDEAAEWLGIEPLGLGEGYLRWFPANFVVHDGYTLEPPDGREEEAAEVLEKVLTRPIKHLANLRVGCEVDISPVGGNWAPADEKKNPMGLVTVKTVRVEVVPPPHSSALDIPRAA